MKTVLPTVSAEESFFLVLQKTASSLQKSTDRLLRPVGLSVAEYMLLRVIENSPGITAREAAVRLNTRAPTVAELVSQLERKKMLERGRDPDDARRLPLRLSVSGRKILSNAKKTVSRWIEDMRLGPSLLESLHHNLSTFLSSLPSYGH